MDGMNFGLGASLVIIITMVLGTCLHLCIAIAGPHFVSKALKPFIIRLFNLDKYDNYQKVNIISYELAVLFAAPLVTGIVEFVIHFMSSGLRLVETKSLLISVIFSFLIYYIFSLTIWKYDKKLQFFQQVSSKQFIVHSIIIYGTYYTLPIIVLPLVCLLLYRNCIEHKDISADLNNLPAD